ncbi:MAG: ATP-dependent helicase [Candidatus Sumerlaeaceae bacterium]
MPDSILDDLNPQQLAAVTAPDGPLLIVAGAGTGKTRVITRRLAMLVRDRGVRPFQIYAATFTNKAADEMKRRVAELTHNLCSPEFHISTFHSMCARILRTQSVAAGLEPNFTICDDRDQVSALKHVMKKLDVNDKEIKPADAQYVINQCKMRMLGPEHVYQIATNFVEEYEDIYRAYTSYLRESSAVDFEDLILLTVRLFQNVPSILDYYQNRFRHVMVDEYQDTNAVQVELVSLLAAKHRNLAVVGDEDQSIYSWRGADINNLLDFQKHFPDSRIVRLEQNYRSTANILAGAAAVIANNNERLGKTLFTEGERGAPLFVMQARSENEESLGVAYAIEELIKRGYGYGDIALFYRIGALGRIFEDRMREFKVPYRIVGGVRFYDRAEIKDMISYLQVVANPTNSIALLRIINSPKRGLGKKSIQTVIDFSSLHNIAIFEAARRILATDELPRAAAGKLGNFLSQILTWSAFARENSPSEVYRRVLEETRYIESLGDPKALEVIARTENLEELLSAIVLFEKEHPTAALQDYLENVSLVNATDELKADEPAVSLMTLHAAKGLEYKAVFMVGMEDSIFPSLRAVMDRGDYEEERRLCYVGITRAREILTLSRSESRVWYGDVKYNPPSGFLRELPHELLQDLDPFNPSYYADAEEAVPSAPDEERHYTLLHQQPRPSARPQSVQPGAFPREGRAKPSAPYAQHPLVEARKQPVALHTESTPSDDLPHRRRGIDLGKRVRHPLLGEGIVAGVSGSGSNLQLILHLDDGGVHHLLARYANLEVLED